MPTRTHNSPTTAERVSIRTRCLYAVLLRGWAEINKKKIDAGHQPFKSHSAQELFEISNRALTHPLLKTSFTKRERDLIATRLGSLPNFRIAEASYRAEPLEVLLWALGSGPSTIPGDQVGTRVFKLLLPTRDLSDSPHPLLNEPRLRTAKQLRLQQSICVAWAWRARLAVLPLTIALADETDDGSMFNAFYKSIIAKHTAKYAKRGIVKRIVGNDFAVGRRSFARAFDEAVRQPTPLEQSSRERLRAINWVLKPAQNWHTTSTNTPLGFVLPKHFQGDMKFLQNHLLNPKDDSFWFR